VARTIHQRESPMKNKPLAFPKLVANLTNLPLTHLQAFHIRFLKSPYWEWHYKKHVYDKALRLRHSQNKGLKMRQ